MNTRLEFSTLLALVFLANSPAAHADDLVKDSQLTQSSGMQVYRVSEAKPYEILVKPKLGLRHMLKEIESKLDSDSSKVVLDQATLAEYNKRSGDISQILDAAMLDAEKLSAEGRQQRLYAISKQLFNLSEDINNNLQPAIAAGLCLDGSCLARTPEALQYQSKQLHKLIKDKMASGIITEETANRYQKSLNKIYRTGIDSFNSGVDMTPMSTSLNNLVKTVAYNHRKAGL